jgi:hypothetical protein
MNGAYGKSVWTHSPFLSNDFLKAPIIFYCGPASDENLILEYGNNLLKQMPYFSPNAHFYYKTDKQTGEGTRATGLFVLLFNHWKVEQ